MIALSYIVVIRIYQLAKNPGITLTINGKTQPLDNIYPVYLFLILFVVIQALMWMADPISENHEPRTYFMTLVSSALIFFSSAYRNTAITPIQKKTK